jgi:O-glycosyl hydrolase
MRRILILTILATVLTGATTAQQRATVNIDKEQRLQRIEGWGSSLCWWANMCGQWEEKTIDRLLELITAKDGLNMNIFRYNIGGGDDPSHANGHMVRGKGKRAEMPGFKASADSPYDWSADEGQRKIMLKIKKLRPDAVFEAFSNSAPYWMTYSGCSAGHSDPTKDNLKPEYYGMFCDYLIDVCKHYKQEYGIEFKTLEPFNEPTSNYWHHLGSQEGCHFDIQSQIELLRVLYPKLQASGLKTVISASDETNIGAAIKVWKAYSQHPDIMRMVKQFNLHTYSGTNNQRREIHRLISDSGIEFWQSETGPQWDRELRPKGNSAFENNLYLAKKLFRDMKIMQPQAWLDWQLVEEGNRTWCQIKANFATEEFTVLKNYYVRQNITRFIRQGYTLLHTENENTLAAISPNGKEFVMVLLNVENKAFEANIDLSTFKKVTPKAKVYRTSASENCQLLEPATVCNKRLNYRAEPMSITTIIAKVK